MADAGNEPLLPQEPHPVGAAVAVPFPPVAAEAAEAGQEAAANQQPAAEDHLGLMQRMRQWMRQWMWPKRVGVVFCLIVIVPVLLIVALAAGLLIAHFVIQREMCLILNNSQKNNSSQLGYGFTIAMWTCIYILEMIEYLILGQATFKFLCNADLLNDYKETLRNCCIPLNVKWRAVCKFICISSLLLTPYLILVIAVPSLNILKELEYKKVSRCYNNDRNEYFVYTAVNYLRYLCAFIVRVAFVITTLVIREKWRVPHLYPAVVAANHLNEWTSRYTHAGESAKSIMKIFQTWFIIPWLIFFITSSVDVNSTIQPWSDEYGSTTARVSYLIFNFNKFIGLLVPFFCATLINSYHRKFYKHMKRDLLRLDAHIQFNIEKEEEYDFVALIEWTDIEVHVDSPIFLLLGLFFAITKPLLF